MIFFIFALLLIPFGGTATQGAADGMRLFAECLLPSLFPFLVCSKAIMMSGKAREFLISGKRFRFFPVWLIAAACGTPSAALIANDAVTCGMSKREASFLCAAANLANPGFVIYALANSMLGEGRAAALLAVSHYVPSLCAVLILGSILNKRPENHHLSELGFSVPKASLVQAISEAAEVMLRIGGTVVFFGVVFSLLDKLGVFMAFPKSCGAFIKGIIEMTNGLSLLSAERTRLSLCLCSFLLSFGGLCIFAQSKLVFPELEAAMYLIVKLLHGSVSFILTWILYPFFGTSYAVFGSLDSSAAFSGSGTAHTAILFCFAASAAVSISVVSVFSRLIKKGGGR